MSIQVPFDPRPMTPCLPHHAVLQTYVGPGTGGLTSAAAAARLARPPRRRRPGAHARPRASVRARRSATVLRRHDSDAPACATLHVCGRSKSLPACTRRLLNASMQLVTQRLLDLRVRSHTQRADVVIPVPHGRLHAGPQNAAGCVFWTHNLGKPSNMGLCRRSCQARWRTCSSWWKRSQPCCYSLTFSSTARYVKTHAQACACEVQIGQQAFATPLLIWLNNRKLQSTI